MLPLNGVEEEVMTQQPQVVELAALTTCARDDNVEIFTHLKIPCGPLCQRRREEEKISPGVCPE